MKIDSTTNISATTNKSILRLRKKFVNKRKPQLEISFIVLYYCLLWGSATSFLNDFDFRQNPFGIILYLIPWFIMIPRIRKPYFTKSFKIVISCVVCWIGLHIYIDNPFNYILNYSFFLHIISGYLICRVYGMTFLPKLVKVVSTLSAISIFLWLILLQTGASLFCDFAPFQSAWGSKAGSFLIYHVIENYDKEAQFIDIIRNSGFAWEPGRFASILVFVLAINFVIAPSKKIWGLTNTILILATLTTFSTTGYIALFFLLIIYLVWDAKLNLIIKSLLMGSLIFASIGIYQMPFIKGKIESKSNTERFVSNRERKDLERIDEQITVDRFEGIALDWLNFSQAPILGYGLDKDNSYISKTISPLIVTSNGITRPLAQYGLPLFIAFIILLFLSFKRIAIFFHYNIFLILIIAYMLISISYSFENTPVIRAITMSAIFSTIKFVSPKKYVRKKRIFKYHHHLLQ